MFQFVSTLMEEVPAFALRMRELRGDQPNVQLIDNPWGHVEDCVATCNCLDSDRTGIYVHCLVPMTGLLDSTPRDDVEVSGEVGLNLHLTMTVDTWVLAVRGQSLCIRTTGRLWQIVISGICTVEDRAIDIF